MPHHCRKDASGREAEKGQMHWFHACKEFQRGNFNIWCLIKSHQVTRLDSKGSEKNTDSDNLLFRNILEHILPAPIKWYGVCVFCLCLCFDSHFETPNLDSKRTARLLPWGDTRRFKVSKQCKSLSQWQSLKQNKIGRPYRNRMCYVRSRPHNEQNGGNPTAVRLDEWAWKEESMAVAANEFGLNLFTLLK